MSTIFPTDRRLQFMFVGVVCYLCFVVSQSISWQRVRVSKSAFTFPRKVIGERIELNNNTLSMQILKTEWIKLFPELKDLLLHMASKKLDPELEGSTSAEHTSFTLTEKTHYQVGDRISGIIQAKDYSNRSKTHGGDFFVVILRRPGKPKDGAYCEVKDRMNGSYNVSCFLPWSGKVQVRVMMLHSSEAIYLLVRNSSSLTDWIVRSNTTMLNSQKKKEYTECSMYIAEKKPEELCEYKDSRTGEIWKCIRPPSNECSVIIWQDNSANTRLRKYSIYRINKLFQPRINYKTAVNGEGTALNVSPSPAGVKMFQPIVREKPPHTFDMKHPSGWFYDSKWTSTSVNAREYSVEFLKQCIKNKDIYFIGDSTLRQLFYFFIHQTGTRDHGPDNSVAWAQPRDGTNKALNCTLHYRSHGPPLHNMGPPSSRHYIANTFEDIAHGGDGSVVFFNIGQHFNVYDPDFLGRRLHGIRKSIISYLSRFPGARIFIKSLHTYEPIGINPSGWFCYRYNVILRHEFEDIDGVEFIDMWELMYVINNVEVHPPAEILKKQVGLLLSFMC